MEWIKISDKTPESGQEVLVYWINHAQRTNYVSIERWMGDHFTFLFHTLDPRTRNWIQVTHWMYLPDPPKE